MIRSAEFLSYAEKKKTTIYTQAHAHTSRFIITLSETPIACTKQKVHLLWDISQGVGCVGKEIEKDTDTCQSTEVLV